MVKPGFWENIGEEAEAIEKAILAGKLKGKLLKHSEHSQFMGSVADLAEKAGLHYCPHIIVMDELPFGPIWMRKLPNAGAGMMRNVMISKSMLDMTGSSTSMRMSPALETVMAHEMSHLKHDMSKVVVWHAAPFALPMIAMAGLSMYERAKAKTEHKLELSRQELYRQLTSNINGVAAEDIEKFRKAEKITSDKWELDPTWQQNITHLARYALVGIGAMAMGLSLAQHASLHAEFRADKFSVLLTDKPEIFKKVLVDLRKSFTNASKNQSAPDNFLEAMHEAWSDFIGQYVHAHPSTEQRLSYIDQVMREKQNAAFVPRPTV